MKLTKLLAQILIATSCVGSAFASGTFRGAYETSWDIGTQQNSFNLQVHPLLNGDFEESFIVNTHNLKSISADLSGINGVSWGQLTISDGTHTFSNFSDVGNNASAKHSDISNADSDHFYVVLKGNVGGGHNDGEYNVHVTAVPEPETYAMLLTGLGLLGFVSRRRATNLKS